MKRILVVGGGAYQVPLIRRIIELGYEAYCVDKNPAAPGFACATAYRCVDIMDQAACLSYAEELHIDAVMTYGATATLPTVTYIGKALGLPTLPMPTAELSKDKFAIKKRLYERGCNTKGDFFLLKSRDAAARHTVTLPCVVKPCDGSGSRGVSIVEDDALLPEALDHAFACARFNEVYVETYIPGEEYSVEAFVCRDEIYVYTVVKTTFRRNDDGSISYGHRTPSGLSEQQEAAIAEEVCNAIRALDITMGSVNFDVILSSEDGLPYIIDCGIRIGQNLIASHLVPLSRGVSVIDNTIALALNETTDAAPKTKRCIATRLLIYTPGIIKNILPMQDIIGTHNIVDVVLRKQVGDTLNPYREKSDTCGWVVAEGNTPDEAENNAETALALLRPYFVIEPKEESV